jgi:DNA-binding transcriptional ArsR family regulator
MAEMTPEMLELVAQRFRLLADPMRLRILHELQQGECSVGELVNRVGASQPNISKHLASLKNQSMVKRRQEGNMAYFSIAAPYIFALCDTVCNSMRNEIEHKQSLLTLPLTQAAP